MGAFFGNDSTPLPPPPPAAPPPVPTIDTAKVRKQSDDSIRRKRGRQASVLTSPEGVGFTPVGTKTLIGS